MRRFSRFTLGLVLLLAANLVSSQSTTAEPQSLRGENLITAREFIRLAYPELGVLGPPVQFVLNSSLTGPSSFASFRVRVGASSKDLEAKDDSVLLLRTEFQFGDSGKIESYFAAGRLVHDVENEKLAKDVEDHERWSAAVIAGELSRRGARFGPDKQEELLSKIPVRALEPMLGELSLISIEFRMPNTERHGLSVVGDICWEVMYQSSTGLQDVLVFEPFGGSLTSAGAVPRR